MKPHVLNLTLLWSSSLFARFEWEIQYLENETTAYEWDDRVLGFLMERIRCAQHAGPDDLAAFQDVIQRLHNLGIHHGDTNQFNFIIRDPKAVLIDFDSARKCNDQDALRKEFEGLSGCLQETSQAGGGGVLP